MKTRSILLGLFALFALALPSLAQQKEPKAIVVYYSLKNGNTRVIAEEIRKNVPAALFRIETKQAYPSEYRAVTEQAKKELESGFRPELKTRLVNFAEYDIIYLGSPNWWGTIAPAVFTFLESNDFTGKTIIPFITHEGSGLGNAEDDIRRSAPKARLINGLAVRGGSVQKAGDDVKAWLRQLGQLK